MKFKSKIIFLILVVMFIYTILPCVFNFGGINNSYALQTQDEKYKYSVLDDGTIQIDDYFGKETIVKIPQIIDGRKVTALGSFSFSTCDSIKSVEIPNTITNIAHNTFYESSNLMDVKIPNTVVNIGSAAFSGCISLKNIEIPDGIKCIEENTFYNCKSLTNIKIPNTIMSIRKKAFKGCTSLTNIEMPTCVNNIEGGVFAGCTNLIETNLEKNPNFYVEKGIIYNKDKTNVIACIEKNLENIVLIPNGVKTIGASAFEYCINLKRIEMADTVINIGERAFLHCENLTNLKFSNSLTTIGDRAFYSCINLINIKIPISVNKIGGAIFAKCINLKDTNLENNPNFYIEKGIIYNKEKTNVIACIERYLEDKVEILDGVTKIDDSAFEACEKLTNVIIPNSVKNIGNESFVQCKKLTNVIIPNSVIEIGEWAFSLNNKNFTILTNNPVAINYSKKDYVMFDNILYVDQGKKVKDVKALLNDNSLKFYLKNGIEILNNDTVVKTGMRVVKDESEGIALTIKGDLTGDGELDDADLLKMLRYQVGIDNNVDERNLLASDIVTDQSYADDKDLMKMIRVMVNLDKL